MRQHFESPVEVQSDPLLEIRFVDENDESTYKADKTPKKVVTNIARRL